MQILVQIFENRLQGIEISGGLHSEFLLKKLWKAVCCLYKGFIITALHQQVHKQKSLRIVEGHLWELRVSNPRPSACKADALNQLS